MNDRLSNHSVVLVLIIVVVGVATLLITKAATITASFEVEDGTLSGNASSLSDSTASGSGFIRFNNPVSSYAGLHTSYPNAFVKPDGTVAKINGVNIRNVSQYSANTLCNGTANWAGFASRGFNAVRLAVKWSSLEPNKDQLSSGSLTNLDDAVNTAKNAGLYVILDGMHITSGGAGDIPSWATGADTVDKVDAGGAYYWTQLANRYKNDNNVVGYDLVNEAHVTNNDVNRLLTMYQSLITAIRAVDSEKIIIIEAQTGDWRWDNANWSIITNKHNLVVSHHSYFAGGDDDGYSTSGSITGNQVYDGVSGYTPTASSASQIAAHYQKMLDMLAPEQLPLYIGEYGISSISSNHQQWVTDNVVALNARNLPRTYWEGCSDSNFALHKNSANTWVDFTNLFTW